jgi:repressor LexA
MWSMSTTGDRIRELRKAHGETQKQLGEIIHKSRDAVAGWELRKAEPSIDDLRSIAAHYNEPIDYLLGGERKPRVPVLQAVAKLRPIPVIGTIRAGEPILAVEEATEYIPFPEELLPSGEEVFFVEVRGDSMIEERIFDGDLALFQRVDGGVADYTIAAILIDKEEVTVKKVHYITNDRHIALLPANQNYRGSIYREDEVRIIGKFLYAIRKPLNGK